MGGTSDDGSGDNSGTSLNFMLEMEKGQIVARILQKRRLCDTLSVQVAILQKLAEENREMSEKSGDFGDIYSELASLHSLEGYGDVDYLICDSFLNHQRPCTPKLLHLPFVILATHPDANVEICMTGDPPYEVHLQLDQSYCLMDHIQMIKMLPEGRTGKRRQQQLESGLSSRSVNSI